MPYATEAAPYRRVVASLLHDSSGHEAVVWNESVLVVAHLAALADCGLAFAYGGAGMSDRSDPAKQGAFTHAALDASDGDSVLVLHVGEVVLRLRQENITLAYVPHPSDTADAGFLLVGTAADEATRAWEGAGRLGPNKIELAIGQEAGLLIGAARSIAIRHPFFASQLRKSLNHGIYRPNDADRLKEEAEVKRLLKSAYALHRADQPNGPLSQDDVNFLGWNALQVGLQPTMELVRAIHGRGSPTVVHPMLKNFYGTLVQDHLTPAPPAPVPEPLMRFWTALAAEVRVAGEQALIPAREALAASERALAAQNETLAQDRRRFEDEQRIAAAAAAERERHVVSLETRIAGLDTDLANSRNAITGYELEIAAARSDRQHLDATLSAARAEATQHLEGLRDAGLKIGVLQARVASLTDASDRSMRAEALLRTEADALQRQNGGLSAELSVARTVSETAIAECATWRTAAEREAVAHRTQAVELAAALARVKRLDPIEEQLAEARRDLTGLEATLRATERERDRVVAELARPRRGGSRRAAGSSPD